MLYLASQSPRRRALLRQLGRRFRIVRTAHRERIDPRRTPSWNAMRNAHGKAANACLPRGASGLVIGADTLLYFQGRVLGKPSSMRQARAFLRAFSGRSHWVYTGVCVREARTGACRCTYDKARVRFKPLTEAAITRLFRRVPPLDKAGGYAIQEDRGELIAGIRGARSTVVGLPVERLQAVLARWPKAGRKTNHHGISP